jgi:hypothetical protein
MAPRVRLSRPDRGIKIFRAERPDFSAAHLPRRASAGARGARRESALGRLGYRVLRLDAELVLEHPEEAVARIRAVLEAPP